MAYQIRITLRDIEPVIWRRLRIPGNITFVQLHQILQAAFGWMNSHLYQFNFGHVVMAEKNPGYSPEELYGDSVEALDPANVLISELFDTKDRCIYEYDFGDSWEHDIIVEKRLKDTKKTCVPICLAGARHRPPEDVGGAGGYQQFLKTIRDLNDPERESLLAWAEKDTGGRLFDPEYFYLNEVNRELSHILDDKLERAKQIFREQGRLAGILRIGWQEPYLEVNGVQYSWGRIGNLLASVDEGYEVTIQVEGLNGLCRGGDTRKNDPMKRWMDIPEKSRELIVTNCLCPKCSKVVRISDYTVHKDKLGLILRGKCSECGAGVTRCLEE